jgi:hypothetical protein
MVLFVRHLGEVDADLGTALEVDAQRNMMPERHAENAGD